MNIISAPIFLVCPIFIRLLSHQLTLKLKDFQCQSCQSSTENFSEITSANWNASPRDAWHVTCPANLVLTSPILNYTSVKKEPNISLCFLAPLLYFLLIFHITLVSFKIVMGMGMYQLVQRCCFCIKVDHPMLLLLPFCFLAFLPWPYQQGAVPYLYVLALNTGQEKKNVFIHLQ